MKQFLSIPRNRVAVAAGALALLTAGLIVGYRRNLVVYLETASELEGGLEPGKPALDVTFEDGTRSRARAGKWITASGTELTLTPVGVWRSLDEMPPDVRARFESMDD